MDFLFLPDLNQRALQDRGWCQSLASGNNSVSAQKNTPSANGIGHSPGFGGFDFWCSSFSRRFQGRHALSLSLLTLPFVSPRLVLTLALFPPFTSPLHRAATFQQPRTVSTFNISRPLPWQQSPPSLLPLLLLLLGASPAARAPPVFRPLLLLHSSSTLNHGFVALSSRLILRSSTFLPSLSRRPSFLTPAILPLSSVLYNCLPYPSSPLSFVRHLSPKISYSPSTRLSEILHS